MYNSLKHMLGFVIKNKGKTIKKIKRKLNFEYLEKANSYAKTTKSTLDEVSWHDMNMDDVFSKINKTRSSCGEETLYSWLRNPLDNETDYKKRVNLIKHVQSNQTESENLKSKFDKIGYCDYHIKEIMESKYEANYLMLLLHIVLSFINLSLFINLFTSGVSIITSTVFLLFPINIFLHYNFKEKYGCQLEVLQYTIKIISYCKVNLNNIKVISPYNADRLLNLIFILRPISKREVSIFKSEGLDLFADYINITFLIKEISYFAIAGKVQSLKEDIIELYDIVGEIDAVLSIAEYRDSLSNYCKPNLSKEAKDIIIEEAHHALLENAVSNTIKISKGVAITGSNMSGKSTFLRTIGLNAILAQSICTSLTKKHESNFFRVITSLSLNDTILKSKSYFLMEAEAIKRMIDSKDDEHATLILIDEIFKGTNPIERYAASMEILNDLEEGNTKVIVATHDLNILPELKNYDFYYFTENISSKSLDFDFKLRSGTAKSRNAVKILEHVKYPVDLVKKINSRINTLESVAIDNPDIS